MSRSLRLSVVGLSVGLSVALACTKPEPSAGAGPGATQPNIQAPELEQVEYVDPLDEARAAAKRATPADAGWREGFDHRQAEGAAPTDAAEPSPSGPTDGLREEFVGDSAGAGPSAPILAPPAPSDSQVPLIDPSLSPRDPNAAQRPPDATPPPR
jgi:hypothetical protein